MASTNSVLVMHESMLSISAQDTHDVSYTPGAWGQGRARELSGNQPPLCFADSIKNAGGRVFVHCQAGISRSATICLAYLMRTNRVKLDEAFEFVKQRRSIISPNFSFMGQLLQFESQVLAPHCSAEAGSPAMSVLDRGASTTTVFNFPVSIPVHSTNSALSYLQSPITTSPSC